MPVRKSFHAVSVFRWAPARTKKASQLPLCSAMPRVAPRYFAVTLSILLAHIVLNVRLFGISPKGFLPEHDTGAAERFVSDHDG